LDGPPLSILDDAFAVAAAAGAGILIEGNLTSINVSGLVTSVYQPSPNSLLGGAPATYDAGPPATLQFDFENVHYSSSAGASLPAASQFASVTLTQNRRTPGTYTMAVTFWDGSHIGPAVNVQSEAKIDTASGVVYGSGAAQPFLTLLIKALP
jgi:hypothetical protein